MPVTEQVCQDNRNMSTVWFEDFSCHHLHSSFSAIWKNLGAKEKKLCQMMDLEKALCPL